MHGIRFIIIVIFIIFGGYTVYFSFSQPDSAEGVSRVMVTELPEKPVREISVLFIGNSYTFFSNMPEMLVKIAESDPDNKTRFIVQSVTHGGYRLSDHWSNQEIHKILYSRYWNYVVLQEQSMWAMFPDQVIDTMKTIRKINDEIKKIGAHTLIFNTWARKAGSKWYTKPEYSFLRNPEYMQGKLNEKTAEIASRLGIIRIPVGDYWMAALAKKPDFPLYHPDGTHPSSYGSYFNALIFYRYFSGYNPSVIGYKPSKINEDDAIFLRKNASW